MCTSCSAVTPRHSTVASTGGCAPPQPIEPAREGRPFLATFSFVGQQSTSQPNSLLARSGALARRSANRHRRAKAAGRPPVSRRSNRLALGASLRLVGACPRAGAPTRVPPPSSGRGPPWSGAEVGLAHVPSRSVSAAIPSAPATHLWATNPSDQANIRLSRGMGRWAISRMSPRHLATQLLYSHGEAAGSQLIGRTCEAVHQPKHHVELRSVCNGRSREVDVNCAGASVRCF